MSQVDRSHGGYDGSNESTLRTEVRDTFGHKLSYDGTNSWRLPSDILQRLIDDTHALLWNGTVSFSKQLIRCLMMQPPTDATNVPGVTEEQLECLREMWACSNDDSLPADGCLRQAMENGGEELLASVRDDATTIVDSVVSAVMKLHKDGKLDQGASPRPQTEPGSSMRKPRSLTDTMLSQTSRIADPATTFSLPEAFFVHQAMDEQQGTTMRRASVPACTTVICGGDITEITWLNLPSSPKVRPPTPGREDPRSDIQSARSSPPLFQDDHLPHWSPDCSDQSVKEDFSHFLLSPSTSMRRKSEPSTTAHYHTPSPGGHAYSPRSSKSYRTPLAAPHQYHHMKDWLFDASELDDKRQSSLYNLGVDAHATIQPADPEPSEPTPRHTRIYSVATIGSEDRSRSASPRRLSRLFPGMGSSLGISSGQRRKSTQSHTKGGERRESGVAQLKAILNKFPPPPDKTSDSVDQSKRAKRRSTGVSLNPVIWRKDVPGRAGSCSEDWSPHVCMMASAEASSASSTN